VKRAGGRGNWGWRREKRAGKSKVTWMLDWETGANEGAEGDKVACRQGGGLGMVQGREGVGGPRGRSREGRGSTGGQQKLPAGGPAAGQRDGRGAAVLGGSTMSRGAGGSEGC